jgi:O-antigen ligase
VTAAAVERLRLSLGIAVTVQVCGLLFSIAVSSVAFAAAAGLFIALLTADPDARARRTGLEWCFAAYILAVLLSAAFARHPAESFFSARRVLLISLVYMIPAAFSRPGALRWFVLALGAASGLQSLAGIAAFLTLPMERLGVFQHYMTSAGMKMIILLLVLPVVLDRATPRRDRVILAVSLALTLFALLLTQTRGAWLAFAAGALVIGVLRHRLLLGALAVFAAAFMLLAPRSYTERVTHMFSTSERSLEQAGGTPTAAVVQSNQSRVRMWRTGWRMFLERPVTGVGEGGMYRMYRTYVPDALQDEGGHLHNTYVHILATHGAVGAVAVLSLFGVLLWGGVRQYRRLRAPSARALTLGALAAFTGFLVNGLTEYNFGDHEIVALLWTVVGVAITAAAAVRGTDTPPDAGASAPVRKKGTEEALAGGRSDT